MASRSYGQKEGDRRFSASPFWERTAVTQSDRQTKSNHAIANIAKKSSGGEKNCEKRRRRRTLEMMVSRAKGL